MGKRAIEIYDTTLRDGSQGEDISFTVDDKLEIAKKLDGFAIDFIEGGWPGSNPRDEEFFARAKSLRLKTSQLAAFGSTRKAGNRASVDPNLKALVAAETPVVTIFGKSSDLHVREALKVSPLENLKMIGESIAYLKANVKQVFYDAEHFFDGYIANPDYALATLKAAFEAGADRLILCETNGGRLPDEVSEICERVIREMPEARFGVHCHNDGELGVANSLAAIRAGAIQVQGTVNGYGERCGNANLCSIIPAVLLKMGGDVTARCAPKLKGLTSLSRFVSEIGNLPHSGRMPYVGESAFAHKGGIHVNAVLKNKLTYEHIDPLTVGNARRVLISDLSGEGNLLYKALEFGIKIPPKHPKMKGLIQELKALENMGTQFEAAEASFEILLRKTFDKWPSFFELLYFRVIDHVSALHGEKAAEPSSEATIKIRVKGQEAFAASEGVGPVHALDRALRGALESAYPKLKDLELKDYKVRVLNQHGGTSSMVRVLIEFGDREKTWRTVGVSPNIIQASYQALVAGIEYKLWRSYHGR